MPRTIRTEVNSIARGPSSTMSPQPLDTSLVQASPTPDSTQMTVAELMKAITARNTDPETNERLCALADKIPKEFSDFVESEKRGHSFVFTGLSEAEDKPLPFKRQADLEGKVEKELDVLQVKCRDTEIYRIGKSVPDRPRLVKVVLPSRFHWQQALKNASLP
uniref:Uncharacterized protein n=1 Tax=Haemonchus contortus TaxID=6289 RepID=A0A7I4Z780_HAECO|nr:unnamed protein product [Haemonchus contortus]